MKKHQLTKHAKKAAQGNVESFAKIYSAFSRSIYFTALRITQNEQDANDVVQETMLRLYENIENIKDHSAITTYIQRTAYHCSIDIINQNKGQVPADYSQDFIADFATTETEFIPEKYLEDKEARQDITAAVDALTPEQRVVLLAYYYEELSVAEIAETLELSQSAVMSRLHRAREGIKQQLTAPSTGKVIALVISGSILKEVLSLEAKASFTQEVSTNNWRALGKALDFSPEDIAAALNTANAGVAAPPTAGIASAVAQAGALAGAGSLKVLSLVMAATVGLSTAGYTILKQGNSGSSPNEPIVTQTEMDSNSSAATLEEPPLSSAPESDSGSSILKEQRPSSPTARKEEQALFSLVLPHHHLAYPAGTVISEQDLLHATGIYEQISSLPYTIATEYYSTIDFNTPDDYIFYIIVTGPQGTQRQLGIIVTILGG